MRSAPAARLHAQLALPPPARGHLSHSMPPLDNMRVCSFPSSRFCLLELLFWPSHAVKLRGGAGAGGREWASLISLGAACSKPCSWPSAALCLALHSRPSRPSRPKPPCHTTHRGKLGSCG